MVEVTVVICTRNRPTMVHRLLDALERQTDRDFEVVVVDQSDVDDLTLDARAGVRVVRGSGVGVSKARNAGLRATTTPWMLTIDDDCVPAPDWVQGNRRLFARHPDVAVIWSTVEAGLPAAATPASLPMSVFGVARERRVSGRWARPVNMGMGAAQALRSDWARRIGGWDERLGPGSPDFHGSEDMDFAWRLFQDGATALLSPHPSVVHEQWRSDEQIVALTERYTSAWAGMCVKQAKLGDPLGAAWLYAFGVKDAARMSLSPLRWRSRLRLACAVAKWRGLAHGTRLGASRSWQPDGLETVDASGRASRSGATVVICTRNRPANVHRVLDALERQTCREFEIVVVDQSDVEDRTLDARAGVRVVRGSGVGLSRARNAGWRATRTPWMLSLDDDCIPDAHWVEGFREAIDSHPDLAVIGGHTEAEVPAPGTPPDAMPVSVFPVARERLVAGRWIRPSRFAGAVAAFRCDWLERVGGWDERLGAGNEDFPAAEDSDIIWRLHQAGGRALLSPRPRAVHEQWRSDCEVVASIEGYNRGWAGLCVKCARLGDPLGAAWLYAFGIKDAARMSLSPLRRRSRLRLACALAKWRGLARGTRMAARHTW